MIKERMCILFILLIFLCGHTCVSTLTGPPTVMQGFEFQFGAVLTRCVIIFHILGLWRFSIYDLFTNV